MGDSDVESLIEQFSPAPSSLDTSDSEQETEPDIVELSRKVKIFRKQLKSHKFQNKDFKSRFINKIKDCTQNFSKLNRDKAHKVLFSRDKPDQRLWVEILEYLIKQVIIERIVMGDFDMEELVRKHFRVGFSKKKRKDKKTKKLKKATLKELVQIAKKHKMSYKGKTKKQIADSLSASRSGKLTQKEKLAIIPFCSSNKNRKLLLR